MNKYIVFATARSRYPLCFFRRGIQFEPPYLDENKLAIPTYPPLNVQVKGYDFTVLEKFSKWVHNTANHMDIEVKDCWATPCEKIEVDTYKPHTSVAENKYNLQIYERNVQVTELSATIAPIFLQVIRAALPEGVKLSVHEHMQEHYGILKIPDLELKALKVELDELGGPSKKK